MGLRVKLNEKLSIGINDKLSDIEDSLKEEEVRFKLLYDKENKDGNRETIMSIGEFSTEVHLLNHEVTYIRTYNNKYNNIVTSDKHSVSPLAFITRIKAIIFGMSTDGVVDIDMETLDMGAMYCVMVVPFDEYKCVLATARDPHGNVFLSTVRKAKK